MEWGGAPFSWIDAMDFSAREKDVIAIDVNKNRWRLRSRKPDNGHVSVESLNSDVTSSSFTENRSFDGNVDLLVANNMIGELFPAIEGTFWQRVRQNLKPGYSSALPNVLPKVAAILKPGGTAIIGQWNTPDFGDELYAMKDKVDAWARFGLRARYIERAPAVEALLDELHIKEEEKRRVLVYFRTKPVTNIPPFIVMLKKPHNDNVEHANFRRSV